MNKASEAEELSSSQVIAVFSSLVHGPHPAPVNSASFVALVPGLKIISFYNLSTCDSKSIGLVFRVDDNNFIFREFRVVRHLHCNCTLSDIIITDKFFFHRPNYSRT